MQFAVACKAIARLEAGRATTGEQDHWLLRRTPVDRGHKKPARNALGNEAKRSRWDLDVVRVPDDDLV